MKLEEGMYVRLNCNYELGIGKTIREIDEDNFIKTKFKDDFECSLPTYMITKASHNITDLIEVGDYVNGKLVAKNKEVITTDNIYIGRYLYEKDNSLIGGEEDIKSIVTKEMFSSVEYRVETN